MFINSLNLLNSLEPCDLVLIIMWVRSSSSSPGCACWYICCIFSVKYLFIYSQCPKHVFVYNYTHEVEAVLTIWQCVKYVGIHTFIVSFETCIPYHAIIMLCIDCSVVWSVINVFFLISFILWLWTDNQVAAEVFQQDTLMTRIEVCTHRIIVIIVVKFPI